MDQPNALTFDGHDLSDLIIVQSFNKGIKLGRRAKYNYRESAKGNDYLGFTSELVVFTTDILFDPDAKDKKARLAKILNVTEPKELTISSEPGIVYYAFPVSNIDSNERSIFGEGTISWEIPDGVSHSVATTPFTNTSSEDEQNYIEIYNPGTENMELAMEATFTDDNGFLAIQNDDEDINVLFGNPDEIDGNDIEISVELFDDHLYADRGWAWNEGVIPPVASNMRQQGTFKFQVESGGEGFTWPDAYGVQGPSWAGPSLSKNVPTDDNGEYPFNWTATWRSDFNTDGGGSVRNKALQVGHQSVTFSDQNGDIIGSVVFEDNTPGAEKSDFAVYVKKKRVYDTRKTNSYYNTARPGSGNHVRVEKMGGRLTVEIAGIGFKKDFPYPDRTSELRKITFYAARYGNHPAIHNNLIRAMNLTKHNVDKWDDIPNKFKNGDVLKYGKQGRNLYVTMNEMNELRLRDVGSTLITAKPGHNTLYLATSSFGNMPKVILRGKARYVI